VIKFQDWFDENILEEYDDTKTLNGILCALFGKIPAVGDTISENGFSYKIIAADKTKINKIKIDRNIAPFV